MTLSYCKLAKTALMESCEKRKKCCQRMLSDILSLDGESDSEKVIAVVKTAPVHFKCASCFSYYLRGLFLLFGNVTDPEKSYHLELSFETEELRDTVAVILSENGVTMKNSKRKNRYLLYVKDSTEMEDFFAVIGANRLAFDLMNSKIVREVRGDANRQMNCDMANIKKTLSAAGKYIDVIEEMEERGHIIRLPADLRETAKLRIENTQASLADLGLLHNPPITKSGAKHRLDKILDFYNDLKTKEN